MLTEKQFELFAIIGMGGVTATLIIYTIGSCIRRSRCSDIECGCIKMKRKVFSSSTELQTQQNDPIRHMFGNFSNIFNKKSNENDTVPSRTNSI
jgi:hypothetical protein